MRSGSTGDESEATTPLLKQYWELKSQAGDALLLFRMGDFYELFGQDAVEAAAILEITLTSRDKNKPNPLPMAGVPYHSLAGYLPRLLKAGRKVAIAEQMDDAATVDPAHSPLKGAQKSAKTIVRREISRVFTPAIQFDLDGAETFYLGTTAPTDSGLWVLALLDASTGDTRVSDPLEPASLRDEVASLPIRHWLSGLETPELREAFRAELSGRGVLFEELPSNGLSQDQAEEALKRQYGSGSLDAFLPSPAAIRAVGLLTTYLSRTQRQDTLAHLQIPRPLHRAERLVLGPRAIQHLDLLPTADGTPSLYALINRTRSSLGARALRRWTVEPLLRPEEITARSQGVRELSEHPARLESLGACFSELYDLERIAGRVTTRLANPRDTLALGRSLALLPRVAECLSGAQAPCLVKAAETLSALARQLAELSAHIQKTQREDAPLVARDGGVFLPGTDPELDRLLSLNENGQRWLVELETRERDATGISSLKVRYNRVFGYYIEITQAHLKSVPPHYQRKQTTVGAERFFTEELKRFEDEIVTASSRQKALELQLFEELVAAIRAQTRPIMEAARALAELDALAALARLAQEPGWVFPLIDDSLDLEIEAGRHPIVDAASRGQFVPNSLSLSPATRSTLLITGPNMGGKSTVMRQAALIVILGQMGAPVPARQARWGSVSALHTRIGAHDAIARGQSTFMVEMSELAHILHHADPRSLIILDEIGRGTSTYDGISVAWATLEWLCHHTRARTLFATHYHELTRLAGTLPGVANAHMAVHAEGKASLRFLYEMREGAANESFGIHVGKLAGLPAAVVARAWSVLEELERSSREREAVRAPDSSQLSLFGAAEPAEPPQPIPPHPVLLEIETRDLDQLTPIEALNFLARLQQSARQAAEARP